MHRRLKTIAVAILVGLGAGVGVDPARAAEGEEEPATRKSTTSISYLAVEPIYATIIVGTGPRGLLLVEMGLDVPDEALRAKVSHALPVLRDAYVRAMLTYGATAVRPTRQPSVDDIANRLQAITDRMMGKPGARVLMAQTAIRLNR